MLLYTSLEIQDEYVVMSYVHIREEKKVHCDVFVWLFGETNINPKLSTQTSLEFQSTGSCILASVSVSNWLSFRILVRIWIRLYNYSSTFCLSVNWFDFWRDTRQWNNTRGRCGQKWFRKLDNERHPFRNPRRAIYDNACTGAKVAIQILSLFSLRSPSTALWWKHEENNLHLTQHLENFFVWESIQVHCSHFRASKVFDSLFFVVILVFCRGP